MAIKGRLEETKLSSVLQLLALSGNSGRLKLTQAAGEGQIVLRKGRILFAASSSVRESLGSMLLCKGHLIEEQLEKALQLQNASRSEVRLGTILVDQGFITEEILRTSVRRQIERVLRELLDWQQGFFRFDRFEVESHGEVEVPAGDFLVTEGISTDMVLLDDLEENEENEERAPEPSRSLGSVMGEVRTPSFTAEVTAPLIAHCRSLTRRGALFGASPRGFSGLGQYGFGEDDAAASQRIRAVRVPLPDPSVFREAIARREPHVLGPEDNGTNRSLLDMLGGGWPTQVLIAPLIVGGRVLMILYGDNLPEDEPIGSIEGLSEVLLHASLTMEKNLLDKRLQHAARLRRSRSCEPDRELGEVADQLKS